MDIFNLSLTSGVKLHNHLINVVVRSTVFLTSATLMFRGTDISTCFRESLGIRDNESRLYFSTDRSKVSSHFFLLLLCMSIIATLPLWFAIVFFSDFFLLVLPERYLHLYFRVL